MIIGLLALAYLIFGGGHQTFLLNPALKKNVDTYVSDSNRKNEIYQLIKKVEKDEAVFLKQTKSVFDKKLVELNTNPSSTTADFTEEYNKFYDSLKVLQSEYVNVEIEIRTYIRPNEWDSIMKKVLVQPDHVKVHKSLMEENQKLAGKLQSACNKYITDPALKKKSTEYVESYKVKGDTLVNAFLVLNYKYLSAVRPYKISAADFLPIRAEMIERRSDYTNNLVDMRFKLKAITPEANWKDLAKELNNNFVYLGAGISK
jgi:hypothetical protein